MGENPTSETRIQHPDWKSQVTALTGKFTATLRRRFAAELSSDAAGFRAELVHAIRRALPLHRRGRPADPRLDAAVRMHMDEGKSFREVLRFLDPEIDQRDRYGVYLAQQRLKAAIRRRRRTTKTPHISVPGATQPPSGVSESKA